MKTIHLIFVFVNISEFVSFHKTLPNKWAVGGRNFVYKLIRSIHSCDLELIIVAPKDFGPGGCPCYLKTFGISFLTIESFLNFNLSQNAKNFGRSKCIAIISNGTHQMRQLVDKVNKDFQTFNEDWRILKPTILFVWPEILDRRNISEQFKKLTDLFGNSNNFLINSDIYMLFASQNYISQNSYKASIWESYKIKTKTYYKRLQLPSNVLNILENDYENEPEFKFYYNEFDNKVGRRNNFMGESIVVSGKNDSDVGWAHVVRKHGRLVLIGGISAYWYWDLEKALNFSLDVIFGDNSIISLPNGSLAGEIFDQLNGGQADISLSISLVVVFRAKYLTFLQPSYETLVHVFFQQPSASSIHNVVTAPFDNNLWLTIAVTFISAIAIVKLGAYLKSLVKNRIRRQQNTDLSENPDDNETRISDAEFSQTVGLWVIAAVCQKSWYTNPKSSSLKLAFICGSLCGLLIYISYSAVIVSTLSVNSIPVQNFVDLVNYNYLFTVYNKSQPMALILYHLIRLFHLRQEVLKVETEEEVSHLLDTQSPKAFLSYQDLFYATTLTLGYTEAEICKLSKVQASDFKYKSGMFTKKGSEFTEVFNHKLLIIRERGFNYRYVSQYERKSVFSCRSKFEQSRDHEPVKFYDVFTTFLVLFIGIILAGLFLLYEFSFKMCKQMKN